MLSNSYDRDGGKISRPYFFAISITLGMSCCCCGVSAPISSKKPSNPAGVMTHIRRPVVRSEERVRYPTRRKQGSAFLRNEGFSANRPFVLAFKNLKHFVFALMDMRRWTATRNVVRLHRANNPTGVATVNANDHGDAKDIYLLAAIGRDLNGIHGDDGLWTRSSWQGNK